MNLISSSLMLMLISFTIISMEQPIDSNQAFLGAIARGHDPVGDAQTWLKNGANPNALDRDGRNALYYAALRGDEELVSFLSKNGVRANYTDAFHKKPQIFWVLEAQGKADAQIARAVGLLLNYGVKVDAEYVGDLLIHWAAQRGLPKTLAILLKRDVICEYLNSSNFGGLSALQLALHAVSLECVELLLQAGADTATCGMISEHLLGQRYHQLSKSEQIQFQQCVRLLVVYGAQCSDEVMTQLFKPLFQAIFAGAVDDVKQNLHTLDSARSSLYLIAAASRGHDEIVNMVFDVVKTDLDPELIAELVGIAQIRGYDHLLAKLNAYKSGCSDVLNGDPANAVPFGDVGMRNSVYAEMFGFDGTNF